MTEILIAACVGFVVGAGVVLALVRWAAKHLHTATHRRATNQEHKLDPWDVLSDETCKQILDERKACP